MAGKQVQVTLPKSMYPSYPGRWLAVCQAPVYHQNRDKDVSARLVFVGYTG